MGQIVAHRIVIPRLKTIRGKVADEDLKKGIDVLIKKVSTEHESPDGTH